MSFLFLQGKCQEYQQLEKTKDNLQNQLTDVFGTQRKEKSVIKELIVKADKQAEDLLGVDDEASDQFFKEKEAFEKELKCLEAKHMAVHDQFSAQLASARFQIMAFPKQAFISLQETRDAFLGAVKRSSTSESGLSAKSEELLQEYRALNEALRQLSAAQDKQEEEDSENFCKGKMEKEERDSRLAARERVKQEAQSKMKKAREVYLASKSVPSKGSPHKPNLSPPLERAQNLPVQLSLPDHQSTATAHMEDTYSLPTDVNVGGNMGDETVAYQQSKKELEKAQKKHLEAVQKKQRKDQHEKPIMTGVTKLQLPLAERLLQDCLAKDTFNSLKKPVDHQMGDIYIYKCGAVEPLLHLDHTSWSLTHTEPRQCEKLFPGQKFPQSTYVRTSGDTSQKKIFLTFVDYGAIVVHYR